MRRASSQGLKWLQRSVPGRNAPGSSPRPNILRTSFLPWVAFFTNSTLSEPAPTESLNTCGNTASRSSQSRAALRSQNTRVSAIGNPRACIRYH